MTRRLLSTFAVLSLIVAGAPAAFGQNPSAPSPPPNKDVTIHGTDPATHKEIKSQTVSYSDLDLSTDSGAQTALKRIKSASRNVCSPHSHGKRTLRSTTDYNECVQQATADAVQNLNAPKVSYAYKSGSQSR